MADCYDQTSLVEFASSKDPAMVNAVEIPSAIKSSGTFDNSMQRTEARSHLRNDVPMKRGKACDTLKDASLLDAGDSSHEKGGTQKFLTIHSQLKEVASYCCITRRREKLRLLAKTASSLLIRT